MESQVGIRYPRVLLVMLVAVKAADAGNLLSRALFGDWPKDRLAQIYPTAEPSGHGDFCGNFYRLQVCDRFLGGLFRRLRGGVVNMVALGTIEEQAKIRSAGLLKHWFQTLQKRLGDWLINTGLWELIFRVRLSKPMERFIEDFKPEIIYCQGYSLGFATLPLLIARRFHIPICFQTTDDWPHSTYAHSPVGWLLRRRAGELIQCAKVRLAFGDKMQREYERRYGVPFEATYHLDDPARFPHGGETSEKTRKIIYTGGLGHRRYEAIQDVLAAVRQMPELSGRVEIIVYSTGIPKDMPVGLLQSPEVRFVPLPTHEQLPAVLAEATVLLLPESFNEARPPIEYSISSKSHLYMMSGRPVLVYGPAFSGTVDYAMREGWGLVVAQRSETKLKAALTEILAGSERLRQLRLNAEACIQRHHDLAAGRKRFHVMLANAAHSSGMTE